MENLSNKISLMKSTINKIKNELTSIKNVLHFLLIEIEKLNKSVLNKK